MVSFLKMSTCLPNVVQNIRFTSHEQPHGRGMWIPRSTSSILTVETGSHAHSMVQLRVCLINISILFEIFTIMSPFHAAIGVLTTRMMLSLRKASLQDHYGTWDLSLDKVANLEPDPLQWRAATDVANVDVPPISTERAYVYNLDSGPLDVEMDSLSE